MATSATVGLLKVLLTANSAEFESAMKRAAGAAATFSKDMKSVSRQAQDVGATLTKAITLPLVGLAAGSIKAAMNFESSFANVGKTVDGVSDKFGKLTPKGLALANTFRQMAKEIPATTDELNAIAAMGGQMGVPVEQLAHFTKNVAALGVAVDGISAEGAAASLASIGNATGTGTTKIQEMASALVHLGNNSNATEADILEFTKRLVGAGHSAGMTVPEVMAIGTAMANVGINAEAGGTAMSTVISKIGKAVSLGSQDLEEFARVAGMSAEAFSAVWKRSSAEGIDLFVKGLSTMKSRGVDLNLTMGELGTEGIRVASTLKLLAGAGDGVSKSIKLANEGYASGNKHLEEAEKKYATTANQLKLLWNQIYDVGITIGNALLPGIQSSIKMMGALIPVVDKLAAIFAMMPGPLQALAVGIAALLAAAGPMIWLFGGIARGASDIVGAFGKQGIATKALAMWNDVLTGSSTRATTALGFLGKAAGLAAAAFVGWQIGRVISDLAGLDQKIADTITHLESLRTARATQAGGGTAGREGVQNQQIQLEKDYAQAVRDGNKALASRLQSEIDAIKTDSTRLAILDTINGAIRKGADVNISYADAVTFLAKKEQERLAGLQATAAEQQRTGASTKALTDKMDDLAAQLKKADADIAQLSDTARNKLAAALKSGAFEMKELEAASGLSEFAIKRFEAKLKETVKTTKEKEKADTAAEKAAAKHAATLAKQADALEKLGVVTENQVLKALGEFGTLVKLATDAGVPLDRVLLALAPHLDALRAKAEASGVEMKELSEQLGSASVAGAKLLDAIARGVPGAVTGLSELPGTALDLNVVMNAASIQAQNTADSFKAMGVKTRAELQQASADAKAHFRNIQESGEASAEDVTAAYKKMVVAMKAAGEEVEEAFNWSQALNRAAILFQVFGQEIDGTVGEILKSMADVASAISVLADPEVDNFTKAMKVIDLGIKLVKTAIGLFKDEAHELTNDLRDDFLKLFGPGGTGIGSGLANLAKQLHALGLDALFKKVLDAKTPEAFKLAMDEVTKAIGDMHTEMARLSEEGGIATKEMLAFVEATKDSAESLAFIASQTKRAADGFSGYLKIGADAYDKLKTLEKDYQEALKEGDTKKSDLLAKEIARQKELIAATAITTQASASAMGAALVGTFGALREQGASVREALEQMGPGIEAFKKQLEATGLSGGEAFDVIGRYAAIAAGEISGPALDAVGMLTKGLQGAHNAGFLTQEMFGGLAGQIMASRQAMIDQGHTAEDVNAVMAKDLQNIWQLQKDFGYEVDEATQLLLDEAEASGLVGDKHRSAMERAAIAMEKAAAAIVKAFGGAAEAAKEFGGEVDKATRPRTVRVDYKTGAVPDVPVDPNEPRLTAGPAPIHAATGGIIGRVGVKYLGIGGFGSAVAGQWASRGTDTVPAMLTPGELVLNEGQQAHIGASLAQAMQFVNSLKHDLSSRMGAMEAPDAGAMTVGPFIINIPSGELSRALKDGGPIIVEAWATEVNRGGTSRTIVEREVAGMVRR